MYDTSSNPEKFLFTVLEGRFQGDKISEKGFILIQNESKL
jgi:hypothetical protein